MATGRALPTETQLYVTKPAPMIGGTPVEGTLAIARRAITWQEAAPIAARGFPVRRRDRSHHFRQSIALQLAAPLPASLQWRPGQRDCLSAEQAQGGRKNASRRQQCLFCQCDETASETRASGESYHGLRPVIGVYRVVPGKANRPVRLLLASLR